MGSPAPDHAMCWGSQAQPTGCNVLHDDGMSDGGCVGQFAYLLFGFGINSPLDAISPTVILHSRI